MIIQRRLQYKTTYVLGVRGARGASLGVGVHHICALAEGVHGVLGRGSDHGKGGGREGVRVTERERARERGEVGRDPMLSFALLTEPVYRSLEKLDYPSEMAPVFSQA